MRKRIDEFLSEEWGEFWKEFEEYLVLLNRAERERKVVSWGKEADESIERTGVSVELLLNAISATADIFRQEKEQIELLLCTLNN